MKTDFIQIASYASKAPSGHNTQPWKFHITDSTITVLPNLDVALPVVDRNNRELFISLGCATENLCIAAEAKGYAPLPVFQDRGDSPWLLSEAIDD